MCDKSESSPVTAPPQHDPTHGGAKTLAEIQEYNRQRHAQIQEYGKYLTSISQPIADEIGDLGIDIQTLSDLINTREPYFEAFAILVCHLSRDYPLPIIETIVRALTVKQAREIALNPLISRYQTLNDLSTPHAHSLKFALANSISYIATKDDIPSIVPLLLDPNNGESRYYFVRYLARYHKTRPDLADVLTQIEGCPHVQREVEKALTKFVRHREK